MTRFQHDTEIERLLKSDFQMVLNEDGTVTFGHLGWTCTYQDPLDITHEMVMDDFMAFALDQYEALQP